MDSSASTTRISLPARAVFEMDALGRELGSIAERLGCDICISGEACVVMGFDDVLGTEPERELAGV